MSPIGTPMNRLREKQRRSVAPVRVQAFRDRAIESAAEAVPLVAAEVSEQADVLAGVQTDLGTVQTDLVSAQDAIAALQEP